jgi:hypothetical protein
MNKDKAIITQVAAKIASELATSAGGQSIDAIVADWHSAFNYVNETLMGATGANESFNLANSMATFNATMEIEDVPSKPRLTGGSLQIAGKQHGDLPSWLIAACQKAGVSKVWDNRDTAVGTRRPWFKQADAPEGAEPAAFWPPKGN